MGKKKELKGSRDLVQTGMMRQPINNNYFNE